jgi:hypothetical protein
LPLECFYGLVEEHLEVLGPCSDQDADEADIDLDERLVEGDPGKIDDGGGEGGMLLVELGDGLRQSFEPGLEQRDLGRFAGPWLELGQELVVLAAVALPNVIFRTKRVARVG